MPAKSTLDVRDDVSQLEAGLDALDTPIVTTDRSPFARVIRAVWPPIVALLILLVVWQIAYMLQLKPPDVMPGPADVWTSLSNSFTDGTAPTAIANSLKRAAVGFVVSMVIGTVLGLLLAKYDFFRRSFGPLITGLQILPSVAWVPAAIIWFGLGNAAMLFVVIMGATPSIANGIKSGVDQIPQLYPKVGRMMGATGLAQIRYVVLPAALPGYLAGLRQGWAFAWRSLMAAELITYSATLGLGLGQLLETNRTLSDMPGVLATIIAILFVGILVELCLFAPLEKRVLRQRGLLGDKL